MGVADIVLQYVQAAIWPVLIASAIWFFRRQIAELLSRLETFEGFGSRMAFNQANKGRADLTKKVKKEQGARMASAETATNGAMPSRPLPGKPIEIESLPGALKEARELAAANPVAAMEVAWAYVQMITGKALGEEPPRLVGGEVWRPEAALVGLGLSGTSAALYAELRRMGHLAVHKTQMGTSTVESYIESCATLVRDIEQLQQMS